MPELVQCIDHPAQAQLLPYCSVPFEAALLRNAEKRLFESSVQIHVSSFLLEPPSAVLPKRL